MEAVIDYQHVPSNEALCIGTLRDGKTRLYKSKKCKVPIWEHFGFQSPEGSTNVICLHCEASLKYCSSTTSLHNHLRARHYENYLQLEATGAGLSRKNARLSRLIQDIIENSDSVIPINDVVSQQQQFNTTQANIEQDLESEISSFGKMYEKDLINKINDSYFHEKNYYIWKSLFRDGKYHCNQCLFVSSSHNCCDIRYHYMTEHPKALSKLEKSCSSIDKRSQSWKFFKICEDETKAMCQLCNTVISRGNSSSKSFTTTSLNNHLLFKHPDEYKQIVNKKAAVTLNSSSSIQQIESSNYFYHQGNQIEAKYKINNIVCDLCKMKLKNMRALKSHMRLHFNKLKKLFEKDHFVCDRCSYISWSSKFDAMKNHYIRAHFPRYKTYFFDKWKKIRRETLTNGLSSKKCIYSTNPEDVNNTILNKELSEYEMYSCDQFNTGASSNNCNDSTNSEEILNIYKNLYNEYSDEEIGYCVKFITRWIKSAIFSGKSFESFENLILTISNEMIDSPLTYTEIYVIVVVSHLAFVSTVCRIPHILEEQTLEEDFYKKLNHTCFWLREFLEGPYDQRPNIWTQYDEDKKFGPLLGGRESKIALHAALQFFPQKLNRVFTSNLNDEAIVTTSRSQCPLVPSFIKIKEENL